MKRLALVSVIGGVLALATGIAFGSTQQWSGTLKGDLCGQTGNCDLTLQVKVKDGKAAQVKNFIAGGVPWTCGVGAGLDFNVNIPKMEVHKRKFTYKTGSDPNNMLKVTGEFDKHLKKVTGTVHATHDDSLAGQCDSGVMPFTAKPSK